MNLRLAAFVLIFTFVSILAWAQIAPSVVTDKGRPGSDTAQDSSRHPIDILAFARVKPGDTVMEVLPGRGYWTRLLSLTVGPKGEVFTYVPTEIVDSDAKPLDVAKATAAEPGRSNVLVVSDSLASAPSPDTFNKLDVAFTFENYHDLHTALLKGADVDAYNKAMFKLLKPGGYYVIIDHAAAAGAGLKRTEDLHRIDGAFVRAEVEKAGFVFDGESLVLKNTDDSRQKDIFDPLIRGRTDRFAYRFVKPRA